MILSIVCLLFVAIIPLCSLNLINYSALLASTSEEVVDDDTENSAEEVDVDTDADTDIDAEDDEVEISGNWADYAVTPRSAISTASQLAGLSGASGSYTLSNNIDLSGRSWTPISNFSGTLDGNGYTISGLNFTGKYGNDIGLFGTITSDVTIKNLIVEGNIDISCDNDQGVGGFVGAVDGGNLTVFNCVNKVNVTCTYTNEKNRIGVSGIVGKHIPYSNRKYGAVEILYCINLGNIYVNYQNDHGEWAAVGGIAGSTTFDTIDNCINYGDVTNNWGKFTGGIVGLDYGYADNLIGSGNIAAITNCINYGDVNGNASCTGGIAGQLSYNYHVTGEETTGVSSCVNLGTVSGAAGSFNTYGEIVGWVGGADYFFTTRRNCYIYDNYYKSGKALYAQKSGLASLLEENNQTFQTFSEYSSVLTGYSSSNLNSNWTKMSFYSTDRTLGKVAPSYYIEKMSITIKKRDSSGLKTVSSAKGFNISGKYGYSNKTFYAAKTRATISSALTFTNTYGYNMEIYHANGNNLGSLIVDCGDVSKYNYSITGGTYGSMFDDIIVVLTEPVKIEPIPVPNVDVYTSPALYVGEDTISNLFPGSEGGVVTVSGAGEDGVFTRDTVLTITITPNEGYEFFGLFADDDYNDSSLPFSERRVERFNSLSVADLVNDEEIPVDEIEGMPETSGNRVKVEWAKDYSSYTYTFKIGDLITGMTVEQVVDDDDDHDSAATSLQNDDDMSVSSNRLNPNIFFEQNLWGSGGSSGGGNKPGGSIVDKNPGAVSVPDDDGGSGGAVNVPYEKPNEPEFKYVVKNISFVSSFDVVFVAYQHDYDLEIEYLGSGNDFFSLKHGFEERAYLAERSDYYLNFYCDHPNFSTRISSSFGDWNGGWNSYLTVGGVKNYFVSSPYVEYVALIEGDIEDWWSTMNWSAFGISEGGILLENFLFGNMYGMVLGSAGSPVPEYNPTFDSAEIPYYYVKVTYKYCESPRHKFDYRIYITDAYEIYEETAPGSPTPSGRYTAGQLVGETFYYGSTQISKETISVGGKSLPATYIPTNAVYRSTFNLDTDNVLESDFTNIPDTSKIIESNNVTVGGRSTNIYSSLGSVATRTGKVPLTGYTAENAYYLSSSYSSPSTRNLKSTSLRDIVATYGNLARNGSEIYLYSYFYVRNPYTVNFRTVFDGSVQAGSMPADETDDIFYVNGVGVSGSTWSISCEPYAFVDVNVTDRLVYTTNGSTTTFYSFDNITVGNRVVSESGTYTFQGMAVNEISSYTVNINFKREFSINTSLLNSDSTPIDYDASIWEVDSAIDLLNIAYRVYCRGYSLANRIVQTADIDFSNVNGGYMLPIGTDAHPFSSVYDGQYHTIENMTIVGGNAQDIGLFGYTNGATIKNLTLMHTKISGAYNVGSIVGNSNNTTFERVGVYDGSVSVMANQSAGIDIFLTNNITVASTNTAGGDYTSVALGNSSAVYTILSEMVADGSEIDNYGDTSSYAGDFVGYSNNSTYETCFVRKSATTESNNAGRIGGFAGYLYGGNVSHAYTSRQTFATYQSKVTESHVHTGVMTDISTSCGECKDYFIW